MKKIIPIAIISGIFLILVLNRLTREKTHTKVTGGTIIQASIGDASYLNPVLASDSASGDINNLVFNGLLKYDKNLKLTGDLAESWEISDDKLKIIFHLRENVLWHDGREFDSSDVKYTYQVLTDTGTKTPYSSNFDLVKKLTAPGKYTVVVEYTKPYSPALESWGMGIIPEHIYRGTDVNNNPHNRKPIGTGPYRFVNWRSDDQIVLQAFEDYFEGKPGIQKVVYKIIPDISVQFMELKKETVDWMSPTPDQWIKETSKGRFLEKFNRYSFPAFQYTYMGYNLKNSLFSDVRVRKAINYALDKEKIIDSVLQGLGNIATGPYPPNSWAYNPKVKDYGHNPKKAKNLLKQAGWEVNSDTGKLEKNGREFSFTLMTNQGNSTRKLTSEIIQAQLREIGMNVDLRIQEWSSFIHQYIDKKQFDAVVLGWSLSVDPDQYSIWHSSMKKEGQYNFVGYSNQKVDQLLEKGRTIFDTGERKRIYQQVHRIIHDDQPYMFLYVPDTRHVIHKRFKNIKVEKAGIGYNFIHWYVPQEERKY
ncbi:MAG: peptide-binding protein [Elusimicrobiota bacterium]